MSEDARPSSPRTCLVVPCYNEEKRLDVPAYEAFFAEHADIAFVFVNDGSKDGTLQVLQSLAQKHPGQVQALDVQPNGGKAEAVRRGMLFAIDSGAYDYVGFWDADLATPLDAVVHFVDVFARHARIDIVFGTRAQLLGRKIERKPSRHYLGRVFATGASLVLALPIYDTQCGAKLFRAIPRCRELFATPFGSRWVFDVELVARYCREHSGLDGIYEQPLDSWRDVGGSKVKPSDFVRAIGEMVVIYRTYSLERSRSTLLRFLTAPFVRYALAGAVGTLFYYLTLALCVELGGISPATAALIGAPVGALINYFLNYNFVFASTRPHSKTFPRFMLVAAVFILLSRALFRQGAGMHYIVLQVIATGVFLILGFALNRLWTFPRRD